MHILTKAPPVDLHPLGRECVLMLRDAFQVGSVISLPMQRAIGMHGTPDERPSLNLGSFEFAELLADCVKQPEVAPDSCWLAGQEMFMVVKSHPERRFEVEAKYLGSAFPLVVVTRLEGLWNKHGGSASVRRATRKMYNLFLLPLCDVSAVKQLVVWLAKASPASLRLSAIAKDSELDVLMLPGRNHADERSLVVRQAANEHDPVVRTLAKAAAKTVGAEPEVFMDCEAITDAAGSCDVVFLQRLVLAGVVGERVSEFGEGELALVPDSTEWFHELQSQGPQPLAHVELERARRRASSKVALLVSLFGEGWHVHNARV